VCLHGVAPGDALVLATRFALEYAYRGGQAILWTSVFRAIEIHDRYLPAPPLRPLDRRGILQVDGTLGGKHFTVVATQFSAERENVVRELRFTRRALRGIEGALALFVADAPAMQRIGFADLRLQALTRDNGIIVFARHIDTRAAIVRV
jgi:hypothetical protein